jgi:hypothetical protein
MMKLHLHSPSSLHGMVLNYLGTGTILPILFTMCVASCNNNVTLIYLTTNAVSNTKNLGNTS